MNNLVHAVLATPRILASSTVILSAIAIPRLVVADTPSSTLQSCIHSSSAEQRQRCDEAVSNQSKFSGQTAPLEGGWRLVRTKNPGGTAETISVMHVADTAKSDIGLAGLSLRCSLASFEVVLITLEHLPRASRPNVILTVGSDRNQFQASVAQSGEELVLPQAASGLATGKWQSGTELSVEIETQPNPIRGIVPIRGLSAALRLLSPLCAAK
jgi:hypothetical protein